MMIPRPTLAVGQTLYDLNVGNAARNCEQKLTKVLVTKVGRTYFYCAEVGSRFETAYHLDDWREKSGGYASTHYLYASEQEWRDEVEATKLRSSLREYFSSYRRSEIPLTTLRAMVALLPKEKA